MKLGIIREGKVPQDKRVPLTPKQCGQLINDYPQIELCIQSSTLRCFSDQEYINEGLTVQEDISNCDILMGIKEVPLQDLIPQKTYLFFSHTIKEQPFNRKLLQSILKKHIRLIDYECLTNKAGFRIMGFGRYAGIVGCYNGFLTYGKKNNLYDLKPAHLCEDREEMERELSKTHLPNVKIVLTGDGRVANGALEILQILPIKRVSAKSFLTKQWDEPIYTRLSPQDYVKESNGKISWDLNDFFQHPKNYVSTFLPYTEIADMYITSHYWHPDSPIFFSKEEMKSPRFNIKVVADISCDINGPLGCTIRSSSIDNPIYGFDPIVEKEVDYMNSKAIAVMAVDNLPCELPKDASEDFGEQLLHRVLPSLLGEDRDGIVDRATITRHGKLTHKFSYLSGYASL